MKQLLAGSASLVIFCAQVAAAQQLRPLGPNDPGVTSLQCIEIDKDAARDFREKHLKMSASDPASAELWAKSVKAGKIRKVACEKKLYNNSTTPR